MCTSLAMEPRLRAIIIISSKLFVWIHRFFPGLGVVYIGYQGDTVCLFDFHLYINKAVNNAITLHANVISKSCFRHLQEKHVLCEALIVNACSDDFHSNYIIYTMKVYSNI